MIVGVPKEIKDNEYRVAMTPGGAKQLVDAGHEVWVETQAGEESGFEDEIFEAVGAQHRAHGGGCLGARTWWSR